MALFSELFPLGWQNHLLGGLGSLRLPSLRAVLTFMATAFLTANLVARWLA